MPTEYITNPLSIVTDALDVVGDSVKALARRKVAFPEYNNGTGYGLPYVDLRGDAYGGYGAGSPGAAHDYAGMAGDLLQCSAVAACIQAKSTALADAPPILEERKGDQWEKVAEHPIIDLLMAPNPYHGYSDLWGATCAAEDTTGQAFWRLEFDRSNTPAEIWTEHPDRFRIVGRGGEYISHYVYSPLQGQPIELEDKAIVHFRRGLNLHNGRVGWTPLSAGHRQVAGDNGAATYHSAILRNSGVMSLLISIKEGQAVGNGLSQPQMQEFVTGIKRKLFGEGAGGIVGLNLPLSVDKMSYSPDEMSLDSLISYYETRICALIGVDPMVVGLGSGTTQKTYANFKEAINDFWERCILPTKSRHAATLNTQLLPLFGLDPAKFRISWDYTNIAALAENKDEIHTRAREDYKAGVIDLDQARVMMGYESEEQYKGKFFAAPPAPEEAAPEEAAPEEDEAAAAEAKAWALKYDPNQPRDELGRFGYGHFGKHPYEMTRDEWYTHKTRDRAQTFDTNNSRSGANATIARIMRKQYLDYGVEGEMGEGFAGREPVEHRKVIEKALSEGKDVPAHVLADYPDLQEKGSTSPPKPHPAIVASLLSQAGVPVAVRTTRKVVSGVKVEKLSIGSGRYITVMQYHDWENKGNREHGEQRAVQALRDIGYTVEETRPGNGIWRIRREEATKSIDPLDSEREWTDEELAAFTEDSVSDSEPITALS